MQQLRAHEQLLASIVDNITEAVYRTGPDHSLIFANRAYLRLSGYDSLDELRQVPRERLYADPRDRARLLHLLATNGEFRNEEIQYINRFGNRWWGSSTSVAIRDPQTGTVLYHIGSVKDISGRKNAQAELLKLNATLEERVAARTAELKESEEKFRALFENSSAAVMLHDEHQYLDVNSATVRLLAYPSREELLGKSPATTSPPFQPNGRSSEAEARRHIEECLAHGSTRFDWVARTAAGKDVPVEVVLTRVEWHGKRIIQAIVNDQSERKKAEAELLRSLAREKELSALKSSFVSMVSHEFRTPLGIIMSSAEILQDYLDQLSPEDRHAHLGSIHKNTRRMAELMEEVLVLSRFDAGKMEFKPEPLDIRAFFVRLIDELLSATDHVCSIEGQFSHALGEVEADEKLLRHIFTNLVSNAIKYSEPGSSVWLRVTRREQQLECEVQDSGIGIPEEDHGNLFNAFQRGRNVDGRPGTGLGLVIVKRCVELHGGKLSFSTQLGKGTTMAVQIPISTGNSQPSP